VSIPCPPLPLEQSFSIQRVNFSGEIFHGASGTAIYRLAIRLSLIISRLVPVKLCYSQRVLRLFNISGFYPAVFCLPVVVAGLRNACLNRLQYGDDLVLSKPGFAHGDLLGSTLSVSRKISKSEWALLQRYLQ